jgi:hypothetical protein
MSGGAPPAKKGRGPVFWVAGGCCGCLLLGLLLVGLLGGWAYVMGKGAADTAHAWLADAREGRMGEVTEKLSDRYRSRLSQADLEEIVSTVQQSVDATFPGRNVENNRVMLTGVLTGPSGNRPIAMRLVRQGGQWKVDDVTFRGRFRTFEE